MKLHWRIVLILIGAVCSIFNSCLEDWGDPSVIHAPNGTTPDFVEPIDLGLSVKWASCNIGAAAPECYGYYYAWGETVPKDYYTVGSYSFSIGKSNDHRKYSEEDLLHQLYPVDDAATINWGGNWRIPTADEFQELLDKCTWNQVVLNGVNVYKVTSKINGNCIYLPAAGRYYENELKEDRFSGNYWTSTARYSKDRKDQTTMEEGLPGSAFLYFAGRYVGNFNPLQREIHYSWEGRAYGYSIRPVLSERKEHLESVDLGLSVKWADKNFEIYSNPYIQNYYGWGDPTSSLTTTDGNYANGVNYSISGTKYDVVSKNYGMGWRMPTAEEFQELLDKCNWKYVNDDLRKGFIVTASNGNQIFIPIVDSREGDKIIPNRWTGDDYEDYKIVENRPSAYGNKLHDSWTHEVLYWTGNNGSTNRSALAANISAYGDIWTVGYDSYSFWPRFTTVDFIDKDRYLGLAIRPVISYEDDKKINNETLEAIDLGLPSGIKWANNNLTESSIPSIKELYGWGDPTGSLLLQNGDYANGVNESIAGTEYDVVTSKLGGFWRMPTKEEYQELFNECEWIYGDKDGKKGFTVIGKNRNTIFIPIKDIREGETIIENSVNKNLYSHMDFCKKGDEHYYGLWTHKLIYWTGTNSGNPASAVAVEITEEGEVWHKNSGGILSEADFNCKVTNNHTIEFSEMKRYMGLAIRPVSE